MTRVLNWLLGAATLAASAVSAETVLKNELGHREVCGGVYGTSDSHGPFSPAVNVTFPSTEESNGKVAYLIFNFEDVGDVGYWSSDSDSGLRAVKYLCDQPSVYANECREEDLGKFIVHGNAQNRVRTDLVTVGKGQTLEQIHFPVEKTGYYCVAAVAAPGHEKMKFAVNVNFQNAFGHLPGADYPLILFHFLMCGMYVLILLVWVVPLVIYRQSVLKVQWYITAMGIIMVFEQAFVALYYFLVNRLGQNAGVKAMLVVVAFWASARLAFTFFLLLIVSCGYSVVHPSLGPKMRICQLLGGALFLTSLFYSIVSYYEDNTQSTSSWLDLLSNIAFFPFVAALAANYYMVLTSLGETVAYLRSRKQTAKVQMYRKLSFILLGSLIAAALQVVVIIVQVLVVPISTFVMHYWQYKWVLNDGWPNIVHFFAMMLIMFIWRPSKGNMRYAMSTQLSQNENDADEFEIGSLHGSSDDEFPEEPRSAHDNDNSEQPSAQNAHGYAGAHRNTVFDADANHELSDLESGDEFEVRPDDHRPENDEDPLVSAPSQQLKKNR